jgi:hypothetical protein
LFQEVTTRWPVASTPRRRPSRRRTIWRSAFRRAEAAHGKYEARIGQGRDANWPDWYAAYMVAEQSGGNCRRDRLRRDRHRHRPSRPYVVSRLAAAGMKVAVIERKVFGGTCVNTGCIPTKTMVASAYAARVAARAAEYGVDVGPVRVDMKRVKARKDAVSAASRTGLEGWLRNMKHCTVYDGHARFESAHEVSVGGERLRADKIFLNVGGRALVPDMPGVHEIDFLTNSSMMSVDFLPRHLIVVGGSLHRSRVRPDVSPLRRRGHDHRDGAAARRPRGRRRLDRDPRDRRERGRRGAREREVHLLRQARRRGSPPASTAPTVHRRCTARTCCSPSGGGPIPTISASKRRASPSTSGATSRSTTSSNQRPGNLGARRLQRQGAFTHTSYNDGEIVIANLLENDPRRVSDRITAYALYVDPPLGRAGMTEDEIRESGRKALVGKRPMTRVGRAVEKGETQGFMKIAVDAETNAILGAAILGTGGDEVIHSILDVMYAKAPWTVIRRAMHIHPTVSELVPTMLSELRPMD